MTALDWKRKCLYFRLDHLSSCWFSKRTQKAGLCSQTGKFEFILRQIWTVDRVTLPVFLAATTNAAWLTRSNTGSVLNHRSQTNTEPIHLKVIY